MITIVHKANDRGAANHGWLTAKHSFSFAGYHDPEKVHFGMLRVLNDDIVAPGMGFGMHPHDNMEIITIPLKGSLQHRDDMGNSEVIKHNEVQVMSAGTGVMHSEFNPSKTEEVNLLQIWVFPSKKNVTPRYDQKLFLPEERKNKFQLIVSPDGERGSMFIQQDAWFSLANLDKDKKLEYNLNKKENGVYAFVIEGKALIADQPLEPRDAAGISDTAKISVEAKTDTQILLIEIPMN